MATTFRAGQVCVANDHGRQRKVRLICRADTISEFWLCEDIETLDSFPVAQGFLCPVNEHVRDSNNQPDL